jgi:cyclic pyranopterin phosphate synthase
MTDSYNRTIDYMRVSLTDRCNLRCVYCKPLETPYLPETDLLGAEEILAICASASELGIRFIKLTGGEPLLREDAPAIAGLLKTRVGMERVSLTTNGVLLSRALDALCDAGIDSITISLDSLDPERFAATTGYSRLDRIVAALHESVSRNIRVKINAVLWEKREDGEDGGEPEWRDLVSLARDMPLDVRFIEMMPLGYGRHFRAVGRDALLRRIKEAYPNLAEDRSVRGAGPAVYYRIPGFRGAIGFISAVSHSFCHTCNRVRLTADGILKPCLCYAGGIDLKAVLRGDRSVRDAGLRRAFLEAAAMKPASHCFTADSPPAPLEERVMAAIGG